MSEQTSNRPDDSNLEHDHVPAVNVGLVPYVDVNSHFERPRNHFSIDAIAGYAAGITGVEIAGVASVVEQEVAGLQLSGIAGIAGQEVDGLQLSGVVGLAGQSFDGLQLSGITGITRGDVTGAQISGVASIANDVDGVQIGLVNIGGHVTGAQIGLVNIADEIDGAPVGLINVVLQNGTRSVGVWTSDTAALNVGMRLGSEYVYSILAFGAASRDDETYWMPGFGLGGRIPLRQDLALNIEALAISVMTPDETSWRAWEQDLVRLQVLATYSVVDHLAVFAGPSLNVLHNRDGDTSLRDFGYVAPLHTFGDDGPELGVGFVAGFEVL